jgi:hypothetical protein
VLRQEEVGFFPVCICYVVYVFESRSGKTYHYYHIRSRRGRDHMLLDLQLPVQSVPITTNVVSLNPAQTKCIRYNIMR